MGDEHEEVKKVCVMDPKVHVKCLWGAEAGHKTTSMHPFHLPFSSVAVLFSFSDVMTVEKKSVQLVCAMNLSLVVFVFIGIANMIVTICLKCVDWKRTC